MKKNNKNGRGFTVVNPNAAGIDIGSKVHYVAVPDDRAKRAIESFGCTTSEEEAHRCPFVHKVRGQEKYNCTIYETRPETCRRYPQAVDHMKTVDCEMLDAGDTDADVRRFMRRPPKKPLEK